MSLFLILALFLPFQAAPTDKCSFSGTVVDSVTGAPLTKVELRLEPVDRQSGPAALTTSDAQGRFAMVDLDPGRYHLKGSRSGYLEVAYGARQPHAAGTQLRLESGQAAPDLVLKLMPAAVIAGTVRDSDGEPIEGADVSLDRLSYSEGPRRVTGEDGTRTDDRGQYRFSGLIPGKYYIGVEPRGGSPGVDRSAAAGPPEISVPTFYSGSPHLALATPIAVSAGAHLEGIDVTLIRSRVFRVTGRVTNAPAAGATLVLADPNDADQTDYPIYTAIKNSSGDFEFRGVPAGAYLLTAATEDLRGVIPVVVGASDVGDVRVTLSSGAAVKGRITAEGDKKPRLAPLIFVLTPQGHGGGSILSVAEDGAITPFALFGSAESLMPGHYNVRLDGSALAGFYVKSIRSRETDVQADGLTVTGPETIDIEVVLASDGGAVEGVVLDKDQHPVPGATIVLAPAQRPRMDLFKTTTTDQNGRYEFTSIAPGDYKLFALDDVEPGAWYDPDFLKDYEKQGEPATLDPKAQATVNLHVATTPDAP